MTAITPFLIEIMATALGCTLVIAYLKRRLEHMLLDLCGTEERAQFWVAFANIVMFGFPLIFALSYRPEASATESRFYEIMGQLGINLGGFLAALIAIGITLSFFILVSPRDARSDAK